MGKELTLKILVHLLLKLQQKSLKLHKIKFLKQKLYINKDLIENIFIELDQFLYLILN